MLKCYIPYAHAKSIYEIDFNFYKNLGIKYIFVDLDNTLDSYKQATATEKALSLKERLSNENIELIITSNNRGKRVQTYAESLGVRYFPSIGKPFAKKLRKLVVELNIDKNELLMIGDQVVTDVCAANRGGIRSILTDKIVKEDQPTTRINRLLDRPLRKKLIRKGLLKDWREI